MAKLLLEYTVFNSLMWPSATQMEVRRKDPLCKGRNNCSNIFLPLVNMGWTLADQCKLTIVLKDTPCA